jgi:hypothetical protein
MPTLRSLALAPDAQNSRSTTLEEYAWMLGLPVIDQLTSFAVPILPKERAFVRAALASTVRPDLVLELRERYSHYGSVAFARGEDGQRSVLVIDMTGVTHGAYAFLDAVPSSAIARVRVVGAQGEVREAVERNLERFSEAAIGFE